MIATIQGVDSSTALVRNDPNHGFLTLYPKPFLLHGSLDDHALVVTADTAKEAFANAIEWHVVEKFSGVYLRRREFIRLTNLHWQSLRDIANTVEAAVQKAAVDGG